MDAMIKCLFVYGLAAVVSMVVAAVIHLIGFIIKKFTREQAIQLPPPDDDNQNADEETEIAIAVAAASAMSRH